MSKKYSTVEICAGAGGQALGLEKSGFTHKALVEIDHDCCNTLRHNRPNWNVVEQDIRSFSGSTYQGVDVLAGGLPCPPFSLAGKQLGHLDERNLFPDAIRLTKEMTPRVVMIENVRGFLSKSFIGYREELRASFKDLGYEVDWRLIQAADFGLPQLRPRVVIIAMRKPLWQHFKFPETNGKKPKTVGQALHDLMAENGWPGADDWANRANRIAPTIVGGSKKHGGPDLGPTRAKEAWKKLGVLGNTIAEHAPDRDFQGQPRLTVKMVSRLQGFPDTWQIQGKKTAAYRQVGNAFPSPVAQEFGKQIIRAFEMEEQLNATGLILEAV